MLATGNVKMGSGEEFVICSRCEQHLNKSFGTTVACSSPLSCLR